MEPDFENIAPKFLPLFDLRLTRLHKGSECWRLRIKEGTKPVSSTKNFHQFLDGQGLELKKKEPKDFKKELKLGSSCLGIKRVVPAHGPKKMSDGLNRSRRPRVVESLGSLSASPPLQ